MGPFYVLHGKEAEAKRELNYLINEVSAAVNAQRQLLVAGLVAGRDQDDFDTKGPLTTPDQDNPDTHWTRVLDPSSPADSPRFLYVSTIIGSVELAKEDPSDTFNLSPCSLTLLGQLPDGNSRVIGTMQIPNFLPPELYMNTGDTSNNLVSTSWESTDSEYFLRVAMSVLQD